MGGKSPGARTHGIYPEAPALFAVIGFAFILLQLLLTRTAPRLELTPDAVLYRSGWTTATIPWVSVGTLTLEPRSAALHDDV